MNKDYMRFGSVVVLFIKELYQNRLKEKDYDMVDYATTLIESIDTWCNNGCDTSLMPIFLYKHMEHLFQIGDRTVEDINELYSCYDRLSEEEDEIDAIENEEECPYGCCDDEDKRIILTKITDTDGVYFEANFKEKDIDRMIELLNYCKAKYIIKTIQKETEGEK